MLDLIQPIEPSKPNADSVLDEINKTRAMLRNADMGREHKLLFRFNDEIKKARTFVEVLACCEMYQVKAITDSISVGER